MTEQRQSHSRRISDCGEDDVCPAHSGTVTGIKGLYALLVVLIGLIGSQMMFQIPALRLDVLNEVKGLTARIVELEKKDIEFAARITEMESRLRAVEPRR